MQVLSAWQAAVALVHAFPHHPDLIAMVEALAEEEGEPSAEALRAAVNANTIIPDVTMQSGSSLC